jgi:hypothetical protein
LQTEGVVETTETWSFADDDALSLYERPGRADLGAAEKVMCCEDLRRTGEVGCVVVAAGTGCCPMITPPPLVVMTQSSWEGHEMASAVIFEGSILEGGAHSP